MLNPKANGRNYRGEVDVDQIIGKVMFFGYMKSLHEYGHDITGKFFCEMAMVRRTEQEIKVRRFLLLYSCKGIEKGLASVSSLTRENL